MASGNGASSNGASGTGATGAEFTQEQKEYLEGFFAALMTRRGGTNGAAAPGSESASIGPEAIHRAAQDRFVAAGKKLVAEELAKRAKNPLDMWDEMKANAAARRFPKGTDVFLHKFHGLFYVAPTQDAFMCRLRIPNGLLSAHQLAGIADLADKFAGGFVDITTRANLQLREIGPGAIVDLLTGIQDLGLTSRGAGADNIRNVTGSPTAGIDPDELIDTRPLAKALHFAILYHRELYGLPRKFNIGFDGGGRVSVLEDTNDIGFAACAVAEGQAAAPGIYFRVQLGGITGHGDFARDTGLLLTPEECVPAAIALVRVFIDHGDRTDRKKARLKYVIERLGLDGLVAEAEKHFGTTFRRFPLEACLPRAPRAKGAHLGVHAQRQMGFSYLGVVVPVGRLASAQLRGLADLVARYGSGIRLTVWQNFLIADVADKEVKALVDGLAAIGLAVETSAVRAGLVACTGNTGCKFAATNTKGQALALADYLDAHVALDLPINIHLTGCPNSCAQHYVGDIGLLGVKVEAGDDMIEAYNVIVGGGAGEERVLGRELWQGVPVAELPARTVSLLQAYLAARQGPSETFHAFAGRMSVDELKQLCGARQA